MLWLVFFLCLTTYIAGDRKRIFVTLRRGLVSAFVEITFVLFWFFKLWKLRIEVVWNRMCLYTILFLIVLAINGTHVNSYFVRRSNTILGQIHDPAFGGRGPGILMFAKRARTHPQHDFDSTCGFPGEGWSGLTGRYPLLKMTTWNCHSLTFERYNYCRDLGYDVLALTELWHKQTKFQSKNASFIIAEPKILQKDPKKDQVRFPNDKAAGVAIMLSKTSQGKVRGFGSEGERVCWVRLKGPTTNIFVIAVYMPHRGRVAPCQDDTLQDLEKVLLTVPKSDCVCILGDFNEQLEGNVQGRTGKWVGGLKSKNADKIMQLLQLHELTAINICFQPRHGKEVHTYPYLHTVSKDQTTAQGSTNVECNDYSEYIGSFCKVKYRGRHISGRVKAVYGGKTKKWLVHFEDGFALRCGQNKSCLLMRKNSK